MTNEEKRKLAVERELELLRKTVAGFDAVVEQAQELALDLRAQATRLHFIENDVDAKLADLDRLMGRPKLFSDDSNIVDFNDLARDVARTYSPKKGN